MTGILRWPGAEGLPQLPFKRLFTPIRRTPSDGAPIVTAYTDGRVTLRSNRAKVGYHEAADTSAYLGVRKGDFVVHGLDIMRGSVGISDSDGAISPVCTVCVPNSLVEPRYAAYAMRLQATSGFPKALARGVREGGADFRRWDTLAELPLPVPQVDEQRAIADYLDRETAQIDAFIAKNEELIALLTERRHAVVVSAITGGLSRSSERVDSGVDWIGAVPSHWEVRPLRWSARIRTGTTPSGDSVFADEPGKPWIRPDDLDVSGRPSEASRWLTDVGASQGKPATPGATLVCTIGATLGKPGRVIECTYFNQQITAVEWSLNDEFLFWVFVAAREAVSRLAVGNTLPILNNDKLGALRIPVPPREEQTLIVGHLTQLTARIDRAIATARDGVDLASERRAALISTAVTGKIDVGVTV